MSNDRKGSLGQKICKKNSLEWYQKKKDTRVRAIKVELLPGKDFSTQRVLCQKKVLPFRSKCNRGVKRRKIEAWKNSKLLKNYLL